MHVGGIFDPRGVVGAGQSAGSVKIIVGFRVFRKNPRFMVG